MGNNMLGMLVLAAGLLSNQIEAMIVKRYGAKHGNGGMFFNMILCLSATIYFLVTDQGGFVLPTGVLVYGLINSVMYAVGFYFGYVAFRTGSFGLTRLFTSFSGILTIFYGVIGLQEPVNPLMILAVVLVFVSVFLMRYEKNTAKEKTGCSAKWVISIVLVVVSNAMISVIGKMQHNAFSDTYKNEYLIVSFVGSALWLAIMGVLFERNALKSTIKHGLLYGFAAGIFNGVNNLFSIIAYNFFPISVLSPVKTGLGMVIGFVISVLVYKEKFSRRQIAAVILGILAVILINVG